MEKVGIKKGTKGEEMRNLKYRNWSRKIMRKKNEVPYKEERKMQEM